jgi:hypothetical protein
VDAGPRRPRDFYRWGVSYHPSQVWRILRASDWTCQKPERRARERDEAAIARWRRVDWPRIKKSRKDRPQRAVPRETGLMLQPLVRRTWAPRGERPVMYCWDRRDRLSVIAGLTLSARRRRVGLYFAVHEANVRTAEVEAFIRRVRRQVGRDLIVVLDRLPAHRSAAKRMSGDERFAFEWLPPYAPDLNPVEATWCHTKYGDLANFVPEDAVDLEVEAELSLEEARDDQNLLRSFFQTARLRLT